jgi:hypothetical protein
MEKEEEGKTVIMWEESVFFSRKSEGKFINKHFLSLEIIICGISKQHLSAFLPQVPIFLSFSFEIKQN